MCIKYSEFRHLTSFLELKGGGGAKLRNICRKFFVKLKSSSAQTPKSWRKGYPLIHSVHLFNSLHNFA